MSYRLENKRALVTGGSTGIGAAIVKRLALEGAHVALTYISKPDQAKEMVKAAQALGVKALAIQADSADAQAVVAAVERTVRELGRIDLKARGRLPHQSGCFFWKRRALSGARCGYGS